MLGPLPPVHRVIVTTCALVAFVGLGAWMAATLGVSFMAPAGAGIGLGIGAIVVLLLFHDFDHHDDQRVRVRARNPRR